MSGELKYVLVDAISSFRLRYCVAVPADLPVHKAKEWAMDSVTCEELEEFSQLHIGDQISSTRILSEREVIKQFDEDNEYLVSWGRDMKLRNIAILDSNGDYVNGQREE